MLKKILTTGVAALGLLLTMQASAHQSNNHHNGRDNNRYHKPTKPVFSVNRAQTLQARLINKGVQNRSLTKYEERKLRQEQKDIAHLEHKYLRGGLQSWERNTLEKRLKKANKRISSYMNNHERRQVKRKKQYHHHSKTSKHSSGNATFTMWIGK